MTWVGGVFRYGELYLTLGFLPWDWWIIEAPFFVPRQMEDWHSVWIVNKSLPPYTHTSTIFRS